MNRRQKKGCKTINPIQSNKKIINHPFFGMKKDSSLSVEEEMQRLRGAR